MAQTRHGEWSIWAAALLLALLLWFYATTEHRFERQLEARIVPEVVATADSTGLMTTTPLPAVARILVSGKGRALLRLDEEAFVYRLPLEGPAGVQRTYRLGPAQVVGQTEEAEVTVERVLEPAEITVTLDWRHDRLLPVEVSADLVPADGYVLVEPIQVEPPQVLVSGPHGQVDRLRNVVTDSLVLRDITEDVEVILPLRWGPDLHLTADPTHVRVRVQVQILAETEFPRIPIRVRPSGGRLLRATPATASVRVRGGVAALAGLDPATDLRLYAEGRSGAGAIVPVLSETDPRYVVTAITPAAVTLAPP